MNHELIAVVEDETNLRELISYDLMKHAFHVEAYSSGEELLQALSQITPSLILLDLMLPGMDGFEVCRQLKSKTVHKEIPIIMLTAKGEEPDIVTGLELGAVDYVVKPFSPRVLVARIRTALRNKKIDENGTSVFKVDKIELDASRHEVKLNGNLISLTNTEFKLLHLLMRKAGHALTRDTIVKEVHGTNYPVTDRSVDVQIVGLRKRLGDFGAKIETVRGVGYKLTDNNN